MAKLSGVFANRIQDESPQFPIERYGGPFDGLTHEAGYESGGAAAAEMAAAGFPCETQPDAVVYVVDSGGNAINPSSVSYPVLRDSNGEIVAIWEEGRWWSQYESARLFQQYMKELRA